MSLAEILQGLHWEYALRSNTTGMGPLWIDDVIQREAGVDRLARPPWAVLYLINATATEWEIGAAMDFAPGTVSMLRAPTLSSSGLGVIVNFSSGPKEVRFADAVPLALKRYMKRLEREAGSRDWETAGNRAAAWERLETAARERQT